MSDSSRWRPTDAHVTPINDLREHEDSDTCWCAPIRDEDAPWVVIHNSMDQREYYERGNRSPS